MLDDKSGSIIARTASAFACAPLTVGKHAIILAILLVYHSTISAKADGCPSIKDEIITDRPDVTNSSVVVPPGSLQIENGVNFSARDGDRVIDGTNTRLRAGIANCLEFLVDTPTYFANVRSPQNSGFSDVAPALKWQISPVPGKIDLSAVFGVALPTGTANIASEWNVHGVLSSLGPDQQADHRNHFCDRKEGDREGEPVCGVRR
jgi:outer membrane putative beta-barrel porin/alpha-amylase